MAGANERLSVVRQWVRKAENAPKNAAYALQIGEDCPMHHTLPCQKCEELLAYQLNEYTRTR